MTTKGYLYNTYYGRNIETDHNDMIHDRNVFKDILLHKFTTPGPVTLREVNENVTTTRDKISLNGVEVTKWKSKAYQL